MSSVASVSFSDTRPSAPVQSSPASEDPFALLLDAVTDNKPAPREPEAPQPPDRRDDAPAPRVKPEADADRNANERTALPESDSKTKTAQDTNTPAKPVAGDEETETAEDSDEDASAADALLLVTLGESQVQTTVTAQVSAETSAVVQGAAQPAVAAVAQPAVVQAAEVAVTAAATPTINAAAGVQAAQTAQAAKKPAIAASQTHVEANVETAASVSADSAAAENVIPTLMKPAKALTAAAEINSQTPQVKADVAANANAGPLPALVETLNAAVTKHLHAAASADPSPQPADAAPKPVVSSNAVAPNFALTMQVSAGADMAKTVADAARAVPVETLAVEITSRAKDGQRRFDIRLDPPELGRIDVRLEVDQKGNASTKLIVERPETLDMLQRDARGLEKALQSAGLKMDAGGLEFSLSPQTGDGRAPPERLNPAPALFVADEDGEALAAISNQSLAARIRGGVDIRI